jgi:thiol-disulfide isomerase/thioredoxin
MAVRSPQIIGNIWLNTPQPITPEELNGKVVLVDFFTYSCVNCIRTIPFLREWWKRYKDLNFLMVGIHTPEFEFEKDPENVAKALKDFGIDWPVVLDNDYTNWRNFANHYWPAKYLFDQNGYITYHHFGEGAYRETEKKIQDLLKEDFGERSFPPTTKEEGQGGYCMLSTPELYCGYLRGRISNKEGYHEDHLGLYQIKEGDIEKNTIALRGSFNAQPEYVESFDGATLLVNFTATEVNLVLAPAVAELAAVNIMLDDKPVQLEIAGSDLSESDVIITKPRMYNLIKSDKPISGILGISSKESNFRAYAFTFSGCLK